MEITQEDEKRLTLRVNPVKNMDLLSLHIWIAIMLIIILLQGASFVSLIIFYCVLLFFSLVPGYLWFLLYPIKITINKDQNIMELQNITASGSNNPQYTRYFFDLRPIEIPLHSITQIEFNKSAPNIWSVVPLWYNPGITFYLESNEYVVVIGYFLAFPSFEKLSKKLADFMGVQFRK